MTYTLLCWTFFPYFLLVVTAKLGSDALSIVQDKKIELHLVLMEVHLPDMGRYEIVKKMRQSSTLPLLSKFSQIRFGFCLYKASDRHVLVLIIHF